MGRGNRKAAILFSSVTLVLVATFQACSQTGKFGTVGLLSSNESVSAFSGDPGAASVTLSGPVSNEGNGESYGGNEPPSWLLPSFEIGAPYEFREPNRPCPVADASGTPVGNSVIYFSYDSANSVAHLVRSDCRDIEPTEIYREAWPSAPVSAPSMSTPPPLHPAPTAPPLILSTGLSKAHASLALSFELDGSLSYDGRNYSLVRDAAPLVQATCPVGQSRIAAVTPSLMMETGASILDFWGRLGVEVNGPVSIQGVRGFSIVRTDANPSAIAGLFQHDRFLAGHTYVFSFSARGGSTSRADVYLVADDGRFKLAVKTRLDDQSFAGADSIDELDRHGAFAALAVQRRRVGASAFVTVFFSPQADAVIHLGLGPGDVRPGSSVVFGDVRLSDASEFCTK